MFGLGLGCNMQPLMLAVQNAMPPQDMGVATASATFFRQMGGTLGTAVFLSILFSRAAGNDRDGFRAAAADPAVPGGAARPRGARRTRRTPPSSAMLQGGGGARAGRLVVHHTLDPVLARPFLDGFASSMSTVFLAAAAVLVVGLFAVLRMKEVPLRTQSGVEAQRGAEQSSAAAVEPSPATRAATATTVAAPVPSVADGARSDRPVADGPVAHGPRPWPRSRAAGDDGARAVVPHDADGAVPVDGQVGDVRQGTGPYGNGPHGNGHAANGRVGAYGAPTAVAEAAVAEPAVAETPDPAVEGPAADPRDRLLAMLLPDPPQALALITAAEQARDAARTARRALADHVRELDRARAELRAQGLSPAQVDRLLELTVEESPDHGGRHRGGPAARPAG